MAEPEQDFMAGLASAMDQFLEAFIARLKDEGLVHDDRPLLSLDQAAARLGVSPRVMGDLTRGKQGQVPVLATVKVIPGGHKGIMVEPREIDRYLDQQRRLSWVAAAGRDTP